MFLYLVVILFWYHTFSCSYFPFVCLLPTGVPLPFDFHQKSVNGADYLTSSSELYPPTDSRNILSEQWSDAIDSADPLASSSATSTACSFADFGVAVNVETVTNQPPPRKHFQIKAQ